MALAMTRWEQERNSSSPTIKIFSHLSEGSNSLASILFSVLSSQYLIPSY